MHWIDGASAIRKFIESDERIKPTITCRGCLVGLLEHLIYAEGWNKMLRYKFALFALRLIR